MEIKNQVLKEISCCSCGVSIWVTDSYDRTLRDNKRDFFCVNGHRQSFTQSDADRLQIELNRKEHDVTTLRSYIETLEKQLAKKNKRRKK